MSLTVRNILSIVPNPTKSVEQSKASNNDDVFDMLGTSERPPAPTYQFNQFATGKTIGERLYPEEVQSGEVFLAQTALS